jgi:hypothetical protein
VDLPETRDAIDRTGRVVVRSARVWVGRRLLVVAG